MKKDVAWALFLIFVSCVSAMPWARSCALTAQDTGWPTYGSDPGGSRYSAESQINRSNVNGLKVAWNYRTGANERPTGLMRKAAFEATPILVDGKILLST